ncbi:polysaccharide deacetylase family protein [Aneurinibacillus tyrosinisolvens]|uniref:polysaccharide deacetylase family protein n=1 Tax=Aneurinibacillus tyrosinisolvens TaxID=1443435 RepID=UPI00063F960A|nr:polysaccharide deacetylase family protein [Aneurinibacillus tyrosinisolvens]
MKITLVYGVLILFIIYCVIPSVFVRVFGFGVFRRGRETRKEIAFTFDDGPDPNFTPLLLKILKKHNSKATFFVLGSKAERYPDLISLIHREGHLIGLHNYVHRTNWIMSPWTARKQLQHSAHIIRKIIGKEPVYYRPPWGLFNLFDFLLRKKYQLVLWSVMVGDWRSSGGSMKIKKKLLKKMKDGAVIVLHDSDQTLGTNRNAPLYMIEALEEVLKNASHSNYKCVRIDEMIRGDRQAG